MKKNKDLRAKEWFITKTITLIIAIIVIILIVGLYVKHHDCPDQIPVSDVFSNTLYGITALIILLYTYETSKIRKANEITAKATEINLRLLMTPKVGLSIFTNPHDQINTRVRLTNFSAYKVSIKLDLKIKLDGKIAKFYDAYCGKEVWNLRENNGKEGHFYWLDLLEKNRKIVKGEFSRIKKLPNPSDRIDESERIINSLDPIPKITMDVEIYYHYLELDYMEELYLNKKFNYGHYTYDYKRRVWVPILTEPISVIPE